MLELDESLQRESDAVGNLYLSVKEKILYGGALLGATALIAAGCGESSSGGGDTDPQRDDGTPALSDNDRKSDFVPGETDEDEAQDADRTESQPEDFGEEEKPKPSPDTIVHVIGQDTQGNNLEKTMTYEEMLAFCQEEAEKVKQQLDAQGVDYLSPPAAMVDYYVPGQGDEYDYETEICFSS